jgi:hypothetical protein
MTERTLDKLFALRLALMIQSHLIWYKHYIPWADELIQKMESPPFWILGLTGVKHVGDAMKVLNDYIYSEPFNTLNTVAERDEYVACLFLRYRRQELSWATTLDEAGKYTDAHEGKFPCEYFFEQLNDLEDAEFSSVLEYQQANRVMADFTNEIRTIQPYYESFIPYFRMYNTLYPH